MVHVTPGVIKPTETHVILVIILNVLNKTRRFPIHMVLVNGITPPPFTDGTDAIENFPGTKSKKNKSIVAVVYHQPRENRKERREWHEKIHFSDSHNAKADWREESNLLENYSEYRQELSQMMEPIRTMRDGHLGKKVCRNILSG